jgi:hypothetical protein
LLNISTTDRILLKQMQNFPQRKDMRRVSLGNLKCYKDVNKSEVIEEKLQRISDFLYHNDSVYPVFSSAVKKQNELDTQTAQRFSRMSSSRLSSSEDKQKRKE